MNDEDDKQMTDKEDFECPNCLKTLPAHCRGADEYFDNYCVYCNDFIRRYTTLRHY